MKKTPIWLVLAISIIGLFEGVRYEAYPDVIGVWSICQGETLGVKPGDTATKSQCDAKLYARLLQFDAEISRCIYSPIYSSMPDTRRVSFVSMAYNVGSKAFCNSSVVRKINAGDIQGACDAMLLWNKAGGKVVQGLVNRRIQERELCLR